MNFPGFAVEPGFLFDGIFSLKNPMQLQVNWWFGAFGGLRGTQLESQTKPIITHKLTYPTPSRKTTGLRSPLKKLMLRNWFMSFWDCLFSGAFAVSCREGAAKRTQLLVVVHQPFWAVSTKPLWHNIYLLVHRDRYSSLSCLYSPYST